jgi:serine/threonine protein kinase
MQLRRRPLDGLTLNLVDTYKKINQHYYMAKEARQQHELLTQQLTQPTQQSGRDGHCGRAVKGQVWKGRYLIEGRIGQGTFGTVLAALDTWAGKEVAVKVIRNKRAYTQQATNEMRMLSELAATAPHTTFDLIEQFDHNGHTCFVFERAHMNLYELIQKSQFRGIALSMVQELGRQLVASLIKLKTIGGGIIHADIKPENIMFASVEKSSVSAPQPTTTSTDGISPPPPVGWEPEVRLIDFGSSIKAGGTPAPSYIQSRFYRAPEVVLQLPYDEKIDVWSLGCVLFEVYTGEPLFRSKSSSEHGYQIARVCGGIPAHMQNCAKKPLWNRVTLKPTDPLAAIEAKRRARTPVAELYCEGGEEELKFRNVLQRMLAVDPKERWSAAQLLEHPFFATASSTSATPTVPASAKSAPTPSTPSPTEHLDADNKVTSPPPPTAPAARTPLQHRESRRKRIDTRRGGITGQEVSFQPTTASGW